MVIFNGYVTNYQRVIPVGNPRESLTFTAGSRFIFLQKLLQLLSVALWHKWGTTIAGWFLEWKIPLKWMTGGSPMTQEP